MVFSAWCLDERIVHAYLTRWTFNSSCRIPSTTKDKEDDGGATTRIIPRAQVSLKNKERMGEQSDQLLVLSYATMAKSPHKSHHQRDLHQEHEEEGINFHTVLPFARTQPQIARSITVSCISVPRILQGKDPVKGGVN